MKLSEGRRPCFLRGDANADGKLDIADPVKVLIFLFLEPTRLDCQDAADANDDGTIYISDAIFLLGYQFLEGNEIPEPFLPTPWPTDLHGNCGVDPTPDALACQSFGRCQ